MTSSGYPEVGEVVGGYEVGRRLGGGGMGLVHEALDPVLRRSVALKVISPDLADDPDFRARFTREAQAQASLDSPHVVHVYAHGEDRGRLWIASQLVPDGDLRTMLDQRGAPPLSLALDLIGQVADGLADAHAAGLVHRDIKPSNVLLRRRGAGFTAYLADFGIARQVGGEHTRTSRATVGTPTYMAPELHTGGAPGVASDVYSLGCLLWAALTGQAPYAGTSDFEIVTAHRERPVPQIDPTSPLAGPINDVLRRTMAKDPAGRPDTAAAVRERLRALSVPPAVPPAAPPAVAAAAGSTAGVGPGAGARPTARSLPAWLLPAGSVAAVVLVVAVVAYLVAGRSADETAGNASDRTSQRPPASRSATPSPSATSTTPSSPTSSAPTGSAGGSATGVSGYQVHDGDRSRAETAMAAAFQTSLGFTDDQARCYAGNAIDAAGLQHLVDIGMFDRQMAFHDIDLADHPDVKTALTGAAVSCATG